MQLQYPNLIYQAIFKNLILLMKWYKNEITILKRQIVNLKKRSASMLCYQW